MFLSPFKQDPLTTEEGVLEAFQNYPALAAMPVRSVRVPREAATSLSKRVCYLESNSVADSIKLFVVLRQLQLEIDGVIGAYFFYFNIQAFISCTMHTTICIHTNPCFKLF